MLELITRDETILLLSGYRWQRFDDLVAVGTRALTPMLKQYQSDVDTVLYIHLIHLRRAKVIEERDAPPTLLFRLTEKGKRAKDGLIKSTEAQHRRQTANSHR